MDQNTQRARELRINPTKSEALIWSLLRGKQVCGLKFRRQHPIGPYITDFACVAKKLIIEIDGGYHDLTAEQDQRRESVLRSQGWDILRFNAEEVTEDVEAVARAIAQHLNLDYQFIRRKNTGAGTHSDRARS